MQTKYAHILDTREDLQPIDLQQVGCRQPIGTYKTHRFMTQLKKKCPMICKRLFSLFIGTCLLSCPQAKSQVIGIKTNVMADALQSPNIGIEVALSDHFTIDLSAHYNPFPLDKATNGSRQRHWLVRPEGRYWPKSVFNGHFFGTHAFYGVYNVGGSKYPFSFFSSLQARRYEGELFGVGLSYGYQWKLSRNWRLEASLGAGYVQNHFERYDCFHCGEKQDEKTHRTLAPTGAALSMIYLLPSKQRSAPAKRFSLVEKRQIEESLAIAHQKQQTQMRMELNTATLVKPTQSYLTLKKAASDLPVPRKSTAWQLNQTRDYLASVTRFYLDSPFVDDIGDGAMQLRFAQGSSQVDISLIDNNKVLNDMVSVIRKINASSDSRIVKILIAGFTSPEGQLNTNETLAGKRTEALEDYLVNRCKLEPGLMQLFNGGENWDGLRRMVHVGGRPWRYKVMDIIDNVPVLAGREKQLMIIENGVPYRYMYQHYFPKLRNVAYIMLYYKEL